MRIVLFTLILVIGAVAAGCTAGGGSVVDPAASAEPVAIYGYDSVAYFAADKASRGNPQFSFFWKGAKWIFSNRENLGKFSSDPERYAPQFGSHCPVSLSRGGKDKGDPKFWRVVKDRLYLFNSQEYAEEFDRDAEAVLEKASENDGSN